MKIDTIENLRRQYYEAIIKLQDKEDIINSMPQPEYESFFPIMNGLLNLIGENIIEIKEELKKLLNEEYEMKEYFEEELKTLEYKKTICIDLINQAKNKIEVEIKADKIKQKHLIFATTEHGNVYVEKDLKNLPEEYFEEVIESLTNLEEGFVEENEQKEKSLQNNAKLSGLHEIKQFKVRIFYKNLSPDTIFVLMARMKKSDNSQLDREEAIIRNKKTQKEFEKLKEKIKIDEKKERILIENEQIKERIYGYIHKHRRG